MKTIDFEDEDLFNLKLSSKRLTSGRCQVKFSAQVENQRALYGYVLVDSELKLKEVVKKINSKLKVISSHRDFHHMHLYSVGKKQQNEMSFMIFDS